MTQKCLYFGRKILPPPKSILSQFTSTNLLGTGTHVRTQAEVKNMARNDSQALLISEESEPNGYRWNMML